MKKKKPKHDRAWQAADWVIKTARWTGNLINRDWVAYNIRRIMGTRK